jgi:hypothetical protein
MFPVTPAHPFFGQQGRQIGGSLESGSPSAAFFPGARASNDDLHGARVEDGGGRRTRMESPGARPARALRLR